MRGTALEDVEPPAATGSEAAFRKSENEADAAVCARRMALFVGLFVVVVVGVVAADEEEDDGVPSG